MPRRLPPLFLFGIQLALTGAVTKHPDLDRINELTRRLEDMCREAQRIREQIRNLSSQQPIWPDSRHASRLNTEPSRLSEFFPSRSGDDHN